MSFFNRIIALLLWLALLAALLVFAVTPLQTVGWLQTQLNDLARWLQEWQSASSASFLVAQAALGIVALLVLGTLAFFEVMTGRRRGVRIRTTEGGSAELDTNSIGRRLQWHLDQLAEVITVVPSVKARGGSVDVKLEIETVPDVDIPMKTDEVVEVTHAIIEQDMGLRLGKLDVRMRCAPFEAEWNN